MEAAVARKEEHALVGIGDLSADSRAHAEAHSTHAARGEQSALTLDFCELGDPHLVLTYVGSDDIVVVLELVYDIDDILRLRKLVIVKLLVVEVVLPDLDLFEPLGVLLLLHACREGSEALLEVAEDVLVNMDIFIYLALVDFELDDLSLLAELLSIARNAVGEARAAGNHEVALGGDHTCFVAAVHADVAYAERVRRGDRAESHQRAAYGSVDQLSELDKLLTGVRAENAAARVDHRALGVCDELLDPADTVGILDLDKLGRNRLLRLVIRCLSGQILRHVEKNGAFSAVVRESKRLADSGSKILNTLDEEARLGDRLDDVYDVYLLKAVAAELVGVDVGGDRNHRDRVDISGGKTRYYVRSAGTGGREHNACFACGTGIAVSRVRSALLVGGQDMTDFVAVFVERVVCIESRAAGIAEHGVYAVLEQTFADDFRAC